MKCAALAVGVAVVGSGLSPIFRRLAGAVEDIKSLIFPPGAFGSERFAMQCTACLACAASCPESIIKPSPNGFGPVRLDYENAGCRFDCNICTTVCPSGALKRLELGSKQWLKIGEATVDAPRCRIVKDGIPCNLCVKACPMGAIFLMNQPDGTILPEVAGFHCIGCGSCQAVCPMQPKAITVFGVEQVDGTNDSF